MKILRCNICEVNYSNTHRHIKYASANRRKRSNIFDVTCPTLRPRNSSGLDFTRKYEKGKFLLSPHIRNSQHCFSS